MTAFAFFFLYQAMILSSPAICSVILSGGTNCSTSGDPVSYVKPGTTVTVTCFVDNDPNNVANFLFWTIPSFGGGSGVLVINLLGNDHDDTVNGVVFTSTVNSVDPDERTTNATLSFTAVSGLDEATVFCRDNETPPTVKNCTMFVLSKNKHGCVCLHVGKKHCMGIIRIHVTKFMNMVLVLQMIYF